MKKLITSLAFVAVLSSPVFAQSYDPDVGSGNIARQADAANYLRAPLRQEGASAFASAATDQGSEFHWPKYNAEGVDQNEPGE